MELVDVQGSCGYDSNPIAILQQFELEKHRVQFYVSNNWQDANGDGIASMDHLAVRYPRYPADFSNYQCLNNFDVPHGPMEPFFDASCSESGIIEIEIHVRSDAFGSDAEDTDVHESCNPTSAKSFCSYRFVVPCAPELMCDPKKRFLEEAPAVEELLDAGEQKKQEEATSWESIKENVVNEPPAATTNEEDGPYCVSEDFPCEGESDDMVFVCHYSARQGYQTFCIPESDSDILRFYPNDYCGPCAGGYGKAWAEK